MGGGGYFIHISIYTSSATNICSGYVFSLCLHKWKAVGTNILCKYDGCDLRS